MGVAVGPYICDGLLYQAEHLVLPWLAERIEGMAGRTFGQASAIGILGRDRIMGGVAYSHWFDHPDGGDCQISMTIEPGTRVTKRMWRHLYGHAFVVMRCRRMSLQILEQNYKAREHVVRAGFQVEGCKREGSGRHNLIQYGLLRSELRDGLPPLKRNA